MAIQSNRYNDPALGEAFNNIASIFAPPGAQDLVGYATAKAKKEDAERLAWLFDNAADPLADRKATMAGVYAPTQSYYAQDQNNATTQRGQDVTAETTRATNLQDNQFGLAKQFMSPLNEGQVQPGLPLDIAGQFDVPAFPRTEGLPKPRSETEVKGDILLGLTQDEQRANVMGTTPIEPVLGADGSITNMYRPNAIGRTPYRPLSETEQKALERQDLIAGGDLTNQMMLDAILGEQAPVKVVDASGNVTYATPGSAIGQTPYVDVGNAPAKEIYSYVTPDGQQGSATFDPSSGVLNDVATGAVLPQGTKTMKLQGEDATAMAGTPSNVTLGQRTVAEATYAKTRLDSYRKLLQDNPGAAGVPGMIRGFAQDVVSGIGEMTAEYGTSANIPIEEVRALAERVTQGERDPAIRAAQSYAIEMAYAQAKLGDPGGEVNVREFERLLGVYDGGIAGNAGVLESLAVFEEQISQRLAYGQALQAGSGAPGVAAAAAPPAAGGGTVLIFDEKGEQVQ